jgi:hypothetical protein
MKKISLAFCFALYFALSPVLSFGEESVPKFRSDDWYDLTYQFELNYVSNNEVRGILSMHNPGEDTWNYSFGYSTIAFIKVDGASPVQCYLPISTDITIEPLQTHLEPVSHYQPLAYEPGTHWATVHLLIQGEPMLTYPVSFTIEPISNQDIMNEFLIEPICYPNPFNPETTIAYDLPEEASVQIRIFNSRGQIVRRLLDKVQPKGAHRIIWDGKNTSGLPCSSGSYVLTFEYRDTFFSKKILLMK